MTMTADAPTGLPEGVYREGNRFFRKIKRLRREQDGSLYYDLVPRECSLVNPYESDEEKIHEARESAARRGLDFYDPRTVNGQVVGWLNYGRKRSEEWPENLGAGEVKYDRIRVPDSENPDLANAQAQAPVVVAGGKAKNHGE